MNSTIKHIATVFPIDADALKPDPKYQRRRSIIHDFSLNASVHGVPSIGRSKSILNRIFWTVSFLGFTSIMIYFVAQAMQSYFSYPTQTSISFLVERQQPFPAVSICNYAPVRFDYFIRPFLNYTNSRNLTNTNDTSTITGYQAEFIRDFIQDLVNRNQINGTFFFPLESMLMLCMYNGVSCNSSNFIPFLSSAYGRCYTFNAKSKFNQTSIRNVTDYGGPGQLQLRLYAHSQQYIPYVTQDVSVGMVILVHENTQLPLIENSGIQLAPGKRHKLTYKKSTYQVLSAPYSDCTDNIPLVMQAMFNQYAGADYAYSPVLCSLLCVATYTYQKCGCTNPLQWSARNIVLPGTNTVILAPLCNITDLCYSKAAVELTNSDSLWSQYCSQCSEACSTVDFIVTPSAVSAPANTEIPSTKAFVENSGITLSPNWSHTWATEIPNNYIAVDVVCQLTFVEAYTEDALIHGVDLLSNIGGLTGLWIGASFLSMMELVEMLYRLIRYHYYMLKRRVEQRNVIDTKL